MFVQKKNKQLTNINLNDKILDQEQQKALALCQQLASSIKSNINQGVIKSFLSKSLLPHGIYMHGGVGRGKTMLMQIFYNEIADFAEIIHFQTFMKDLHLKLHKLQSQSTNKIIESLAIEISARSRVICIDEFEISDISNAMIIKHLFHILSEQGVFIFLTTNIAPNDLYKDGIQRESFCPFIEMIKSEYKIIHLDNDKDYRYDKLSHLNEDRMLYKATSETCSKIQKIKAGFANNKEIVSVDIETFGRKEIFKQACDDILFTNFDELFQRDFSYADYANICCKFKVIIVESIRKIEDEEESIFIRFVNFIDNAYYYKILLFAEIDCDLNNVYTKPSRVGELSRVISRLYEMNSNEYLTK